MVQLPRAAERGVRSVHNAWVDCITRDTLNFYQSPLSSMHPQGGARMGTDPATSVVAPDGRPHGLDSVYVADASLFRTSVKVNPYETVMLLATHVAERVAGRV